MPPLEETRQAIQRQNLRWEAGQTEIGNLIQKARNTNFGFAPAKNDPKPSRSVRMQQALAAASTPLPPHVDWRAKDGSDYTTPVRDQGTCGACVAFAVCAVAEARLKITADDAHLRPDLSEAHLFFCNPGVDCMTGWTPAKALDRMRKVGVGDERDFEYRPNLRKCREIAPVAKVRTWSVHDDHIDRKKAIMIRGPVVAGMTVYRDFGWYRGGIYRPTTSEIVGRHAVAIIGYDDEQGYWIVKNSWGTGWGEGGFAKIGYGSCGIDSEFPFYDPDVVPITPPQQGLRARAGTKPSRPASLTRNQTPAAPKSGRSKKPKVR